LIKGKARGFQGPGKREIELHVSRYFAPIEQKGTGGLDEDFCGQIRSGLGRMRQQKTGARVDSIGKAKVVLLTSCHHLLGLRQHCIG
jgi:hypothetical protein